MRIAVGLSGGVDSAVTAALLKQQGHEVIGVFMKNWSDDFGLKGECPWEQDQKDAMAVAEKLGIEFLSYNFERQYRENVIEYFFSEYKAGRTPNPDVLCNSEIKFNVFLKKCLLELNVDKIATGHYARVVKDEQGTYHLLKGADTNKDQSYFLCRLTQEELSKSLFPVGELTKPEVRKIAEGLDLPVAKKKDSQGICFVGKINVTEFLRSELGNRPGDIVDRDSGKKLGEHNGLWFYTIGQREGLGLGGGPWFVIEKNLSENILYVARGTQNPLLYTDLVGLSDLNIINSEAFDRALDKKANLSASLRYRQKPELCDLQLGEGKTINLKFSQPQRAVAPGQFACLFVEDELIASGIIN